MFDGPVAIGNVAGGIPATGSLPQQAISGLKSSNAHAAPNTRDKHSKNTVAKLLSDAGAVSAAFQDEELSNLTSKRIQVDEIWSFTYAKQMNVAVAKAAPEGAGDT